MMGEKSYKEVKTTEKATNTRNPLKGYSMEASSKKKKR